MSLKIIEVIHDVVFVEDLAEVIVEVLLGPFGLPIAPIVLVQIQIILIFHLFFLLRVLILLCPIIKLVIHLNLLLHLYIFTLLLFYFFGEFAVTQSVERRLHSRNLFPFWVFFSSLPHAMAPCWNVVGVQIFDQLHNLAGGRLFIKGKTLGRQKKFLL